jgi:hypothetical protein
MLYNTALNFDYNMTPRTVITSSYHHEYLDFVPVNLFDWTRHDASLSLTRSLNPKTSLVAGYTYHRRDFEGDRLPLVRHDINVGVNYNSALPFSPRTTFTFAVGSTALSRAQAAGELSSERRFIRLIGHAELEQQVSRSWRLGVFYSRQLQYIEGISDVFLADSVTGNVSGFLSNRVAFRHRPATRQLPVIWRASVRRHECDTAQLQIDLTRSRPGGACTTTTCSESVTLQTGIRLGKTALSVSA